MRGECLMLLRLVLEGDEDVVLGMRGLEVKVIVGGYGVRGDRGLLLL